eukprot:TRINITY_DN15685_c0_g1_i1.p1 TRINITY_DN15685_c0_g1~~TRINITY_DN15685_c0_g1_i1.p1  ORF type:complete len:460 (-),score=68.51 TRINITY_DN15685_c0_g1_i1:162-1541(-)
MGQQASTDFAFSWCSNIAVDKRPGDFEFGTSSNRQGLVTEEQSAPVREDCFEPRPSGPLRPSGTHGVNSRGNFQREHATLTITPRMTNHSGVLPVDNPSGLADSADIDPIARSSIHNTRQAESASSSTAGAVVSDRPHAACAATAAQARAAYAAALAAASRPADTVPAQAASSMHKKDVMGDMVLVDRRSASTPLSVTARDTFDTNHPGFSEPKSTVSVSGSLPPRSQSVTDAPVPAVACEASQISAETVQQVSTVTASALGFPEDLPVVAAVEEAAPEKQPTVVVEVSHVVSPRSPEPVNPATETLVGPVVTPRLSPRHVACTDVLVSEKKVGASFDGWQQNDAAVVQLLVGRETWTSEFKGDIVERVAGDFTLLEGLEVQEEKNLPGMAAVERALRDDVGGEVQRFDPFAWTESVDSSAPPLRPPGLLARTRCWGLLSRADYVDDLEMYQRTSVLVV